MFLHHRRALSSNEKTLEIKAQRHKSLTLFMKSDKRKLKHLLVAQATIKVSTQILISIAVTMNMTHRRSFHRK